MATKKIIYFTAGAVATSGEKADIEALNALCEPAYSLSVANGSVPDNLGMTPNLDPDPEPEDPEFVPLLQACDYVAGTVPSAYDGRDEIDPDAPPPPDVGADRAVISDGDVITIGEETFTFTIVDGEVTAIVVGGA